MKYAIDFFSICICTIIIYFKDVDVLPIFLIYFCNISFFFKKKFVIIAYLLLKISFVQIDMYTSQKNKFFTFGFRPVTPIKDLR